MTSLVKHVHAFAKDVQLTEEEWFEAIKFLTAVGQKCDDKRQAHAQARQNSLHVNSPSIGGVPTTPRRADRIPDPAESPSR